MDTYAIDTAKLCRLCVTDKGVISLFDHSDQIQFCKKVMRIAPIKVYANDGLPETICMKCAENISKCYQFSLQIVKSDNYLRKILEINDTAYNCIVKQEKELDEDESESRDELNVIDEDVEMITEDYEEDNNELEMNLNIAGHKDELVRDESFRGPVVIEEIFQISSNNVFVTEIPKEAKTSVGGRKNISCGLCNKSFKSKSHLEKHSKHCNQKDENRIFDKVRKHMCEVCGLAFGATSTLLTHKSVHNQKAYSCELCKKRFTRPNHLKIHMRIHDNIKPYICEQCGRSFTKSSDLCRHRLVHSNVKKHSCKLCPKTFKRSGDITAHMRFHTGDRPYKCDTCEKAYKSSDSLRKHKRDHKQSPTEENQNGPET